LLYTLPVSLFECRCLPLNCRQCRVLGEDAEGVESSAGGLMPDCGRLFRSAIRRRVCAGHVIAAGLLQTDDSGTPTPFTSGEFGGVCVDCSHRQSGGSIPQRTTHCAIRAHRCAMRWCASLTTVLDTFCHTAAAFIGNPGRMGRGWTNRLRHCRVGRDVLLRQAELPNWTDRDSRLPFEAGVSPSPAPSLRLGREAPPARTASILAAILI
jgi:hypothetical protein